MTPTDYPSSAPFPPDMPTPTPTPYVVGSTRFDAYSGFVPGSPDEQPAPVREEPEEPPVRLRPQSGTLITMFGAAAREQPHANIERAIAHLDGIERGVGCPFCREEVGE